jgi:replicative DNA helicase
VRTPSQGVPGAAFVHSAPFGVPAVGAWRGDALVAATHDPGRLWSGDLPRGQAWQAPAGVMRAESAGSGPACALSEAVPVRTAQGRIADLLDAADLELDAVNDVTWDTVMAIDHLGDQQVFDATVLGSHNFVADGVVVHNSIEQDADMVILLHREDAYERESPRAGEADLIVAKHRNGPTDTITVAFQGHYSRFVDMQA